MKNPTMIYCVTIIAIVSFLTYLAIIDEREPKQPDTKTIYMDAYRDGRMNAVISQHICKGKTSTPYWYHISDSIMKRDTTIKFNCENLK